MQTISQKTSAKKPEIKVEATAKGMTVNAGLIPVLRFMDALLLDKMISDMVSTPERAANAKYSFSDVVQMTVCAQIAGATALEHVSKICGDDIISRCAGWENVPHATNLGRIIKSVQERNISELESLVPKLRDKVWKHMVREGRKLACAMSDMIIDMDSTVQGVCGRQEGAQKGYNPHKKGQLAYHPLLAFCAETKEILHSWYRCGSAYTSNGAVEFMKELMYGLRKGVKYLLRAEYDAERRIVVFAAFKVVKHPHIHVHLPDIGVAEFFRLQVDKDKTFEKIIVEDEINVEMGGLSANAELTANKGKTFAEFHEKVAQADDESTFELTFSGFGTLRQIEKFEDVGILQEVKRVWFPCGRDGCCGRPEEALEAASINGPLQNTRAPLLLSCFFNVVLSGLWVSDPHDQPPMRPAQFATQCVAFSALGEG